MADKKKTKLELDKEFYNYVNKFVYSGYAPNLYKHNWKAPAWSDDDK